MMAHPCICFIDDTIFIQDITNSTDYLCTNFPRQKKKLSKRIEICNCGKFIMLQKLTLYNST